MTNCRNSSIELLRLVAMAAIVLYHLISQGLGYQFIAIGGGPYLPIKEWGIPILFISFLRFSVDAFVIISGFYKIKLKVASVFSFALICASFSAIHLLLKIHLSPDFSFSLGCLKPIVYPLTHNDGWFIRCYFILMLASPLINKLFESNKRFIHSSMFLLTLINLYVGLFQQNPINPSGYTAAHMIYMYCVGRYISVINLADFTKRSWWIIAFILSNLFTFLIVYQLFRNGYQEKSFLWIGNNSPFVMISAIAIFCIFLKIQIHSSIINFLASGALGIYLFHAHHFFFYNQIVPRVHIAWENSTAIEFATYIIILTLVLCSIGIFTNILIKFIVKGILKFRFISWFCRKIDGLINATERQ